MTHPPSAPRPQLPQSRPTARPRPGAARRDAEPLRTDTRRDTVIDVIRGLAIFSMIVGHLASGSLLSEVVHTPTWVDGATLFVLLAGLVLGMIQVRTPNARAGAMKLVRRGRLIWITHIGIALSAITVASLTAKSQTTPDYSELGGVLPSVWFAGTLQVNPPEADILSMYVLLFVIAIPSVLLLRANKLWVLVVLSALGYLIGLVFRDEATLEQYPGGPEGMFNIATWQALFVSGLVVGWYWNRRSIGARLRDPKLVIATWCGLLFFILLANVQRHDLLEQAPSFIASGLQALFAKGTFGPGRFLVGWLAFAALYGLLHMVKGSRTYGIIKVVFLRVGQRSLDSFVILAAFVIVADLLPFSSASWVGASFSLAVFGAAWLWAQARHLRA